MATYTCIAGYEFPSGDEEISRTCQSDGTWSDLLPQCQRMINIAVERLIYNIIIITTFIITR